MASTYVTNHFLALKHQVARDLDIAKQFHVDFAKLSNQEPLWKLRMELPDLRCAGFSFPKSKQSTRIKSSQNNPRQISPAFATNCSSAFEDETRSCVITCTVAIFTPIATSDFANCYWKEGLWISMDIHGCIIRSRGWLWDWLPSFTLLSKALEAQASWTWERTKETEKPGNTQDFNQFLDVRIVYDCIKLGWFHMTMQVRKTTSAGQICKSSARPKH